MNRRFPSRVSLRQKAGLCVFLLLSIVSLHAQTALETKLNHVIVSKVDFKEVSLDSALDFMAQMPVKTKQMEDAVNIVKGYKSDPTLKDATISLSLTNVPWTELMRYVCLSANVRVRYEAYAVLVTSIPPPTPTPSPTR